MNQTAFITEGDQKINQLICNELLEKGYRVHLQFDTQQIADGYSGSLPVDIKQNFMSIVNKMDDTQFFRTIIEQSAQEMEGLDLFIHGNEWVNEENLYEKNAVSFGKYMANQFQKLFLWNHYISIHMAKQRKGQIVFPLLNDSLYYLDYPSSPTLDHGKISMMKCLSRELTPFDIRVNAITFGYYDHVEDRESRKVLKKQLEIYALKPSLPKLEQMIPALHVLLKQSDFAISGQNLHIGAGMETSI